MNRIKDFIMGILLKGLLIIFACVHFIIRKMKEMINELIREFGFEGISSFWESSFGFTTKKVALITSMTLAGLASKVNELTGLEPLIYTAFIILIVMEFVTGILASKYEGKKIESKRFGRVILKIIIYTSIIGIIDIFSQKLYAPIILGYKVNIYKFIYYAAFNLIGIQLVLSVFENLDRLGFEESSKVYRVISRKAKKFLNYFEEKQVNK